MKIGDLVMVGHLLSIVIAREKTLLRSGVRWITFITSMGVGQTLSDRVIVIE